MVSFDTYDEDEDVVMVGMMRRDSIDEIKAARVCLDADFLSK